MLNRSLDNPYLIRRSSRYHFWRLAVVLPVLIFGISGCVNESKLISSGLQLPQNHIAVIQAKAKNLVYITVRWRRYQLVQQLQFETQSFGIIQLNPGFISDGSSSLIADDAGSRLAGFLHDALYRGSAYLEFPQGFPGKWSKSQADQEYCFQLERLGASKYRQSINCQGLKSLPTLLSTWEYHRVPREKYWKVHAINIDQTTRQ